MTNGFFILRRRSLFPYRARNPMSETDGLSPAAPKKTEGSRVSRRGISDFLLESGASAA